MLYRGTERNHAQRFIHLAKVWNGFVFTICIIFASNLIPDGFKYLISREAEFLENGEESFRQVRYATANRISLVPLST